MSAFILRLKLLLADRIASVCYVLCTLVMIFVFFNMNMHAADNSKVPIGLVCESDSDVAVRLCERIINGGALRVTQGSMEELSELLMDGYIGSIFIIGDDYEDKLRSGVRDNLIRVVTPSDDTSSIIVQDIVAGYMMYDVCFFRTYDEYTSLPATGANRLTEEEFSEFVAGVASDPDYGFSFDISYIDISDTERTRQDITTAMVYRQIIAGLVGLLLMVLVVCGCNGFALEHGRSIAKRRKTTGGNLPAQSILEMLAVLLYLTPAIILSSIIMLKESGPLGSLKIFLLGEALCAFFILVCFLIAKTAGSASSYQLVGTIVCLVLGACGFISTFSALIGTPSLSATPVAIYIKEFADTLV